MAIVGYDPHDEEGPRAQPGSLLVDEGEEREVPQVHAVGDAPEECEHPEREHPGQDGRLGAGHAEQDGRGGQGGDGESAAVGQWIVCVHLHVQQDADAEPDESDDGHDAPAPHGARLPVHFVALALPLRPDAHAHRQAGPDQDRLRMGVGAEVEAVDVGRIEEERHFEGGGDRACDGDDEEHAQRTPDLHDAEEHQWPDEIELLLDRERPGVDQRRRQPGHVEVVGAAQNEVPVGHVEEGGQCVTAQRRVGPGRDEDPVEDGDPDEHDEERRQQPPGSTGPEGAQFDGAPLAPLHDQQRGDEEPRQGEEAVEEEEPARRQVDAGVHAQDREHGHAPDPVERREIGQLRTLAGASGETRAATVGDYRGPSLQGVSRPRGPPTSQA